MPKKSKPQLLERQLENVTTTAISTKRREPFKNVEKRAESFPVDRVIPVM